jgi:hypothetical protein
VFRELSVAEQRYQAVLAVIEDGLQVTEAAAKAGVTRQALHSWLSRYLATAGVLGLAGAAAVDSLAAVAPAPGQTVLISGATGGAGAFASSTRPPPVPLSSPPPARAERMTSFATSVPPARWTGAVTSSRRSAPSPRTVSTQSCTGRRPGDPASLAGLLADGGTMASTLGFGPEQHPAAVSIMADPNAETLSRLADDVVAGLLSVPVTATYRLDEAGLALADYGAGALGKLAVSIR